MPNALSDVDASAILSDISRVRCPEPLGRASVALSASRVELRVLERLAQMFERDGEREFEQ